MATAYTFIASTNAPEAHPNQWSHPVDATLCRDLECALGGAKISPRVYCGGEDGVMGSLEAEGR
jgi:hypothetical protein